ncbi:unnamed protein product, partial [Pylaiella littoralis]
QEFVAICAHLPAELKDDLSRVAALSEETHRLTAELSRDQAEILERAKAKYRKMARPEQLKNLIDEDALQRAHEKRRKVDHGVTEKVSITKKMYGALDACIKSIDDEIDKLEKDVKESYGVIPDIPSLAPEVSAENKKNAAAAALAADGGLTAGPQTRAGLAAYPGVAAAASGGAAAGVGALGAVAGGVARGNELVSSNEPVYCVCRQIGWGDMIGCDNEDCEHGEWFHYHCVGLEMVDQKQLIFWLCPGCAADAREKERREQLVKKAVSANTTPVKLSAAVKLPENGEQEEEDEDNDNDIGNGNDNDTEEGGAKVEDLGNQDKEDKPRDGRGSGSSAPGGKSETSMATGSERGGEPLRATGGSGGGGAAG